MLIEKFDNYVEAIALIHQIIDDVNEKIKQDSWQNFEIAFLNIHPEFSKNLISQFPDLTAGELKLSILIRLGMSIKDTASLLYLSQDSLKVARSRLRKKLQINSDISLLNFMTAI